MANLRRQVSMTEPTYEQRVLQHPTYGRAYQQLIQQGTEPDIAARQAYEQARQGMDRAKRTNRVVIGVLLAVGALLVAGTIGTALSDNPTGTDQPGKTIARPTVTVEATQPEPEPVITPAPADFELTVKELSKQCFGSAGCSLTFRVHIAYGGLPLPDDKEYTVIYTVTGDESGPQKNTFTLRGDQVEYPSEEFASTRSSAVKLVAKVTEVLPE